jgi:hypothetical protein
MGIRYTKKKETDELKNTADPWHVLGMHFGAPLSTTEHPRVSLTGGLGDMEVPTLFEPNANETQHD